MERGTKSDFDRCMQWDEVYEDFSNLLTTAYSNVIPVRSIKIRNRQKHPYW